MSKDRQRLSARDYKHAGRAPGDGFDFARYQQFGYGLALGLVVAMAVWLYEHRTKPGRTDELTEVTAPEARTDKGAGRKSAAAETADDPTKGYTFYDDLPKFEVIVPEKDHGARRDLPDQPVTQPGVYVLQVISYKNKPDADRMRDKLVKLGMETSVQHVVIDVDEFYRVRVGPIKDLDKLNATRRQLRAADIDAVIYRVGD